MILTMFTAIHPIQFEQPVRRDIQNLTDLSVTRDRHRLPWGIAVPGDETQTVSTNIQTGKMDVIALYNSNLISRFMLH